ncbi:MAG TPA: response regulator, partial [Bacteroidia bacterium]|nr:response regulator [Bacteroidia bacterium]
MRIVIVEDEKRVRSSLINVLKLHYPKATVVGEADDVVTGIEIIKKQKPDVVLLDIKMPGGTGFDLLKQLKPLPFNVIFITAFNQYAVQAFKFSAIDYLLKPVIPQELVDALQRVEQKLNIENSNLKLDVFMN